NWSKTVLPYAMHILSSQDSFSTISLRKENLDELQPNEVIEATFHTSEQAFNKNQHIIKYDHIPTLQYFTPASTLVLNSDLTTTVQKVGYIKVAGDFIPTFLRLAGIDVTFLTEADLSNAENVKE